ncbi:MAG TPA: PDDEXK nuclease domain-containing protein [Leptospiraceae bacterium]|nr:PDDEXK nuclease domain-containing protein [Leptospiraceae bacterium]
MKKLTTNDNLFYNRVANLLRNAKQLVVHNVNSVMVNTYYLVGKMIVEKEQQGKMRAEYGKELIQKLSKRLKREFGKGFSVDNLENMRRFYIVYSKSETVSRKFIENKNSPLNWSHYQILIRMEKSERQFYEIESIQNNWSVRELKRQFNSALFQRLSLSKNKKEVKRLSKKGQIIEKPTDLIKDTYILEFLSLPELPAYTESKLESALINKLELFLLELGKGFTFVSRQKRISFEEKHFFIDLVFYNRILRSFVLIDLKMGELKHQDLGQMQMYVNFYDANVKSPDENKTIGIIVCRDKNDTLIKITLPKDNHQIFASRYKTILPNKNDLKRILNS